jgi:hypothetical protein
MSTAFGTPAYQEKAKATLVSLVTALLRDKPKDPVGISYTHCCLGAIHLCVSARHGKGRIEPDATE